MGSVGRRGPRRPCPVSVRRSRGAGWPQARPEGRAGRSVETARTCRGVGLVTAVGVWSFALGSLAAPSPLNAQATGAAAASDGEALVRSLGCGGCHEGLPFDEGIRSVAPPLGTDAVPLAPAYVFNYLSDPRPIRPDIAPARMPRFELTEAERLALALFVTNERELRGVDDGFREAQRRHPTVSRETGRDVYLNLGCGACHTHPEGGTTAVGPDLSAEGSRVREAWLRAYVESPVTIRPAGALPGRGSRMPDFRFTAAEASAVTAYLMEQKKGMSAPTWQPGALSPFSMQKAETLLRDRWSCLGCHQLGGDGGRIGPPLDGVAQRLTPAFLRAFIEDPAHLAPGTVMPASLEQADRLDLMASFLLQRPGDWSEGEPQEGLALSPPLDGAVGALEPDAPSLDAGRALYQGRCATCHGVTGAGDGFNAPYLPTVPTVHADAGAMSQRPDDTLYDGIHAGGWILGKSHRMPAFGASLSPPQIRSLVLYIRELCGCEGPAWSRDGRRGS